MRTPDLECNEDYERDLSVLEIQRIYNSRNKDNDL
jgi:hypothetical protein